MPLRHDASGYPAGITSSMMKLCPGTVGFACSSRDTASCVPTVHHEPQTYRLDLVSTLEKLQSVFLFTDMHYFSRWYLHRHQD